MSDSKRKVVDVSRLVQMEERSPTPRTVLRVEHDRDCRRCRRVNYGWGFLSSEQRFRRLQIFASHLTKSHGLDAEVHESDDGRVIWTERNPAGRHTRMGSTVTNQGRASKSA